MFNIMKVNFLIVGLLVLSSAVLGGCGTLELGIATPEIADAGLGIPEGVIIARELALEFMRESYGDSAPDEGLQWQADYIEQGDSVGSGAFQYTASNWRIVIEYPIVAPEATVYTVEAMDSASDFHWRGQVDARGAVMQIEPALDPIRVTAWPGHIITLPEGSGALQAFVLLPDGAGEFELVGADEQVNASIAELRDREGSEGFVHVWGELDCGVDTYQGCRLLAERLRSGTEVIEAEPVDGWQGVIYSRSQPAGSGGDDFFVLAGEYPVEYGIWSQDEALLTDLEALRDTGTPIQIWGDLVAGIPDWAGTQIRVARFERVESEGIDLPAQPTQAADERGWEIYVNERYGYEIQFPPEATLEEMGIHGFPSDENGNPVGDIPEGLEPGEVFEYLRQTYGENLCIQISYALGYITISVPENAQFRYATCGRTGVGAGELIPREEKIQIDGSEVIAEGFEFRSGGELLPEHNETFHLILPDGTRIEYGSRPSENATYQDYLVKGKPVLLEILSTYRSR